MGCTQITKTKPLKTRRLERNLSEDSLGVIRDFNTVCQHYTYKRGLGKGRYGQVFLAESLETKQQVAIKAIPRLGNIKETIEWMNEIKIHSELDHPNIVKYLKHYHSEKYLYIAMEYCEGEELFKTISTKGKFTESETLIVMEKLLRAVNHCHHLDIIHCDLKPENIIYSSDGVLKIVDFGLSIRSDATSYEGLAGTSYYIAPEIVKTGLYSKACDLWSLGIIMHIMLSGYTPIAGETLDDILENIKEYQGSTFDSKQWKGISREAKDLLRNLLDPNHKARITAAEALKHPWFTSRRTHSSSHSEDVLEALKRYCEFPELKKDMLEMIVKSVSDAELQEYQQMFLEFDKEKTGLITSSELEQSISESKMTKEEIEEITRKINNKGHAFITYSAFIATLIATKRFLTEERLSSAFRMLKLEKTNVLQKKSTSSELI